MYGHDETRGREPSLSNNSDLQICYEIERLNTSATIQLKVKAPVALEAGASNFIIVHELVYYQLKLTPQYKHKDLLRNFVMRLVVFKWGHDCAHYNDDQCCGQWKSMTDAQEMSVSLSQWRL